MSYRDAGVGIAFHTAVQTRAVDLGLGSGVDTDLWESSGGGAGEQQTGDGERRDNSET